MTSKCITYSRVSTADQADHGTSLSTQAEATAGDFYDLLATCTRCVEVV